MGPIQALVRYAEQAGLHPYMEEIKATEKRPMVGVYLGPKGKVTCKQLPEGTVAFGCRAWSRTGFQTQPRPFRDDAVYTLERGQKRDAYAQVVARMILAHPGNVPLGALHAFLQRRKDPPASWLVEDASYVPFYDGKPVSEVVLHDYDKADHDPYGLESYEGEREVFDLATGKKCLVSKRRPLRLRGFGSVTTGVTMMSVEDIVTTSHWSREPRLSIPLSERSMNLHTAALQKLIHRGSLLAVGKMGRNSEGGSERLRYFVWSEGSPDEGEMVMQALKGRATLDEIELFARTRTNNRNHVCVLGALESMRFVIMSWHCVPANEVLANLLRYARVCNRDGKVLGARRLLSLTLPYHRCLNAEGNYDPVAVDTILNGRTDRRMVASLVDHIIEGDVFPAQLKQAILVAVAQGCIDEETVGSNHVVDQLTITENAA